MSPACKSIKPADITELKTNKNPTDVIRLTFDGLAILMLQKTADVVEKKFTINKVEAPFIADSYEYTKVRILNKKFFVGDPRGYQIPALINRFCIEREG